MNNKKYIKGIEVPQEIFNYVKELESQIITYGEALSLVAAPARPDGTYNHCREACEALAKDAFKRTLNLPQKNIDSQKTLT